MRKQQRVSAIAMIRAGLEGLEGVRGEEGDRVQERRRERERERPLSSNPTRESPPWRDF